MTITINEIKAELDGEELYTDIMPLRLAEQTGIVGVTKGVVKCLGEEIKMTDKKWRQLWAGLFNDSRNRSW